jgi:hypothetical protein
MESMDGFTFTPEMTVAEMAVDRFGVIAAKLTDLMASVRFRPVGLTGAQMLALGQYDGASAYLPGQRVGTGTDLVISGTGLTVTLYSAGVSEDALNFGEEPRLGELVFVPKRTWTAGVADPLWAMATS